MFKAIMVAAAAMTMTMGAALASDPDKWDQRGADQVEQEASASDEVILEDGILPEIDLMPTASTNNATTKDDVEEPTDLRRYNR